MPAGPVLLQEQLSGVIKTRRPRPHQCTLSRLLSSNRKTVEHIPVSNSTKYLMTPDQTEQVPVGDVHSFLSD